MIPRKEMTGSLVFLLVGAGYLAYNTGYSLDTWNNPGPGVFPLMVGSVVTILAAWQLVRVLRRSKMGIDQERAESKIKSVKGLFRESGEGKPFILVVVFIVYLLMIKGAGFFASNFLFVTASSRLLGARDWKRPIALAAGVDLFCYLLFEVWLKLSLPRGYLF
jgi:hypothetical protein